MEILKIWGILVRRKGVIIAVFSVFFLTAVIGTKLVTPTYKATAKLYIKKSNAMYSLLSSLGFNIKQQDSSSSNYYYTEIALAKLRPLLEKTISSLNLKDRNGKVMSPEKLIKWSLINKILPQPYIETYQFEDADMLAIDTFSPNPSEAAKVSNKLAELVINESIENTRKEYGAIRLFIESQINNVREEYYKSLSSLKDFMINEGTVNMTKEVETLISKVATLKNDYEENEKNILVLEKNIKEAREKLEKIEIYRKTSEEFAKSDQMNSLKTKLNELLISIAEKSLDYTKEHPEYKKLEKDIETVNNLITKEAKVVLNTVTYSIDPVYDTLYKQHIQDSINREGNIARGKLIKLYIDRYQAELLKMPVKNIENSKLELALSVNKEMYKKLLEYMTQAGIAQSLTLSEMRIIEEAVVPEKPRFPKKPLNYMLGVLLGLFWGLVSAFFIEYIDNTIKSPGDTKGFKSLNILGSIPMTKYLEDMNIISSLEPTLPVVEAYRSVRNRIMNTTIEKPATTIAVTSTFESEGKSSVSANIAVSSGMAGKKTVIVDLNLRRPSLNSFFNFTGIKGITDVLADSIRLEEAVVNTGVKGVDLLPSGPIPHNPSGLIDSQRLKDVIKRLGEMYDLVIIDMPQALTVDDAVVIGKVVEGIIYVIEPGKVTFSTFEHVIGMFEKSGLNLIGLIFNKS